MDWIYILECEDDYYYVGQTRRLYRRFWEHFRSDGGVNTSTFGAKNIAAVYKFKILDDFFNYNNYVEDEYNYDYCRSLLYSFGDRDNDENNILFMENNIAEHLIINEKKVRGGKYVNFDVEYKHPSVFHLKDLPNCFCGLPCDIKKNKHANYLFFRCSRKNIWSEFESEFGTENPCDFFKKYEKDEKLKRVLKKQNNEIIKLFGINWPYWMKNVEISEKQFNRCIVCFQTTKCLFYDRLRKLCIDCFINKNKELEEKYGNGSLLFQSYSDDVLTRGKLIQG